MIAFYICACFKVLLPKCSQESIVLSGLGIPRKIPTWVLKNLLDHIIVHGFQTCFLHPFFPSRTFSRDLKRMKETIVTKLECMKTIPLPHRGQGMDPMTLYLPLIFSLFLQLHVYSAPSLLPRPTLPWFPRKGKMVISPGAMMWDLGGSVVFGERAKLCDYLKVNTIYLHLLSYGLTKGHHC